MPTLAVLNVVYAVPYPLAPAQGISTAAKAGIGTSSSIAGIAIIVIILLLIRRTKKRNNGRNTYAPSQATGPGSTAGQSQSVMPSMLPNQSVQAPGSFGLQGTSSPPPQMQQMHDGFLPQNSYGQQPVQQVQHGQVQPPVQYPSLLPSTVSPPPPLDGGYSNQGGYAQLGSMSAYAPSSPRSPDSAPQGYGYQADLAPAAITRRPVPTSPTRSSPPLAQGYGYGVAPGQ